MRAPLAPPEERVYHFLLDFLAEHTFQPSVRDIGRACRIPSTKSVTDVLAALERKGYLAREKGRSRGVRLVGWTGPAGTVPVPVLAPDAAEGVRVVGHLALDRALFPVPDLAVVVAPHDAPGILAGDHVVLHPSARAEDGDVVALRVGGAVHLGVLTRQGAVLQVAAGGGVARLAAGDDGALLGPVVGAVRAAAARGVGASARPVGVAPAPADPGAR